MTTIRDVAKKAGVAPMTVSRVINDSGYASQKTRQRVEAAIAELNYVPNSLARSLKSNQTHTLALIVSDITNPFWTTVARGAEDAASAAGFNVILCNTDENEEKQELYLNMLLQKQVDGFLFVPVRGAAPAIKSIQAQNIPVVVLDRRVPDVEVDVIRGSSRRGACELVQYLLGLGHQHIAILSGPKNIPTVQERVSGYKQALEEVALSKNEQIYYGQYTQTSGYHMAQQVLQATPQPTAIFAANNFIAIGTMKAIREANLRVPQDISVVSFDDLPDDLLLEPFVTAMVQPAYDMGNCATDILLQRIERNSEPQPYQEIVFPTKLIERYSCQAIKGQILSED